MIVKWKHNQCDWVRDKKFFLERGYNVIVLNSFKDFKKNPAEIVFYEQPWFAINTEWSPLEISKYALCFYVPYAVIMDIDHSGNSKTCSIFYKTVYKTFIFNKEISKHFSENGIFNMIAVGHPKLDAYSKPLKPGIWKNQNKFKIIYAPHHSLEHSNLKWGTWTWNGDYLLKLARNTTDKTEWVFKPHPRFKYALTFNKMTEEEAEQIFSDWNEVATVYNQGDYFDIFRNADLLITDCGSFITEWLPSGKPCIHLITNQPDESHAILQMNIFLNIIIKHTI